MRVGILFFVIRQPRNVLRIQERLARFKTNLLGNANELVKIFCDTRGLSVQCFRLSRSKRHDDKNLHTSTFKTLEMISINLDLTTFSFRGTETKGNNI